MKTMNLEQMEVINGGLDCQKVNSRATLILTACLTFAALAGGPVTWILAPSALGLNAAAIACWGK